MKKEERSPGWGERRFGGRTRLDVFKGKKRKTLPEGGYKEDFSNRTKKNRCERLGPEEGTSEGGYLRDHNTNPGKKSPPANCSYGKHRGILERRAKIEKCDREAAWHTS